MSSGERTPAPKRQDSRVYSYKQDLKDMSDELIYAGMDQTSTNVTVLSWH